MKKELNSYTTKVPQNILCLGQYQINTNSTRGPFFSRFKTSKTACIPPAESLFSARSRTRWAMAFLHLSCICPQPHFFLFLAFAHLDQVLQACLGQSFGGWEHRLTQGERRAMVGKRRWTRAPITHLLSILHLLLLTFPALSHHPLTSQEPRVHTPAHQACYRPRNWHFTMYSSVYS